MLASRVPGTRQVGLRLPVLSPWVIAAVHRALLPLLTLPSGRNISRAAQRWRNGKI